MNIIFAELLRKGVLVFMDDILIYSATQQDHVTLLKQVFNILARHKFLIKRSKCSFATTSVEYLGHVISRQGVATDPTKLQAIIQCPSPKNIKQLRGFLGLTRYYRKFIKDYGIISRPPTKLLRKNVPFLWTQVTEDAIQSLK